MKYILEITREKPIVTEFGEALLTSDREHAVLFNFREAILRELFPDRNPHAQKPKDSDADGACQRIAQLQARHEARESKQRAQEVKQMTEPLEQQVKQWISQYDKLNESFANLQSVNDQLIVKIREIEKENHGLKRELNRFTGLRRLMRVRKATTAILLAFVGTVVGLSVHANDPPKTQQYALVDPTELANLRKAATTTYDKRSLDTLRHMYTSAALTAVVASRDEKDIAGNVELAKSYGYAMIKAQQEDERKREERKAK